MRSAAKSTCSAVGKSFGFLLDSPTSKSTSIFPSRERVRKPALLITRMAQRRRLKTNFQALPNGQDMIAAPLLPPGRSFRINSPDAKGGAKGAIGQSVILMRWRQGTAKWRDTILSRQQSAHQCALVGSCEVDHDRAATKPAASHSAGSHFWATGLLTTAPTDAHSPVLK
jgi:hypothetical protein